MNKKEYIKGHTKFGLKKFTENSINNLKKNPIIG